MAAGAVIAAAPDLSHRTMMYSGTDAIRFLAENLRADDPLSSSHWREYHARFRFSGEGFEGLTGFGGIGATHRGIRLLVDLWYLRLWMGDEAFEASVDLVADEADLRCALADNGKGPHRVIAIRASDHRFLRHCPMDLAINIASMQEMDPGMTAGYFEDLRAAAAARPVPFYCCYREEKTLQMGRLLDSPAIRGVPTTR